MNKFRKYLNRLYLEHTMHHNITYARTLHPGASGDEDPRKRGILRNTRCRSYRAQLQCKRQLNIIQGLLILIGVFTLLAMLWCRSWELTKETRIAQLAKSDSHMRALYYWVFELLGLVTANSTAATRTYYCTQPLNSLRIFRQMSRQVRNQELALARLQRVMMSERRLKSVALLGAPGVGKTLTAMALRQQFPWPDNVHTYSWNTYVQDVAQKLQLIRNFLEQLSDCGQNLVIIDNLSTCDYKIVPIYNKILLDHQGNLSAARNQTVTIIYIFSLQVEYYWQQFELLQQLPMDTTIINYRHFGRDELLDCLESELQLEHKLDESIACQIVEEALLNVDNAGCKQIRQLILQHGLSDLK